MISVSDDPLNSRPEVSEEKTTRVSFMTKHMQPIQECLGGEGRARE